MSSATTGLLLTLSAGTAPATLWATRDGGHRWTARPVCWPGGTGTSPPAGAGTGPSGPCGGTMQQSWVYAGAAFYRTAQGVWHGVIEGESPALSTDDEGRTWQTINNFPALEDLQYTTGGVLIGWQQSKGGRLWLLSSADGGRHWRRARLAGTALLGEQVQGQLSLDLDGRGVWESMGHTWVSADAGTHWRELGAGARPSLQAGHAHGT